MSNNVNDYHVVAQGKTTIPGVDDGEEMQATDVSLIGKKKFTKTELALIYLKQIYSKKTNINFN